MHGIRVKMTPVFSCRANDEVSSSLQLDWLVEVYNREAVILDP